jgi:hypothetical protein
MRFGSSRKRAGLDNFQHISLLLHSLAGRQKAGLGERTNKPVVLTAKVESLSNAHPS